MNRPSLGAACSTVATVALLIVPALVRGQPTPETEPWRAPARAAFARGEDAYARGVYTEAEDAFREAMNTMPADYPQRPVIWFNIAQSIERQGREEDALDAWEHFRREAANVADPELLVRADDQIRELRARLERRGQTPRAGGARSTLPGNQESAISPIGPILMGIGGAMLIAGGVTGAFAISIDSDLETICVPNRLCPASATPKLDRMEALSISTDVLLFGGGAAAIAGLVLLFVLDDGDAGGSAMARPTLWGDGTQFGLALTGRF